MKNNIEQRLKDTLKKESRNKKNCEKLASYEKALEGFNEMVSKGLVKERGYTLRSISDTYNHTTVLNMK